MNRKVSTLIVVLAVLPLVSCGGDGSGGGGGSVTGPKAVPGDLTAALVTPATDDRAIQLSITGPGSISAITAANVEYLIYTQSSPGKVTIAIFGNLTNGPLLKFSVPDVNASSSYSVAVSEIVDPANNPRPSRTGYSVTISK